MIYDDNIRFTKQTEQNSLEFIKSNLFKLKLIKLNR